MTKQEKKTKKAPVERRQPGIIVQIPGKRSDESPSLALFAEAKRHLDDDRAGSAQEQQIQSRPDTTQPNQTQDNQSQPKTTQPNHTQAAAKTKEALKVETSPVKNFTKVPNSITEAGIPQKYFKGLSKHTYDVLYKQTRGAINPKREIQLTKTELGKLTGLSDNTVSTHLKHLKEVRLISAKMNIGKHEGSVYEVFVLEELDSSQPNPTNPKPTQANPTEDKTAKNLAPVPTQNLGGVGTGNVIENTAVYGESKTSFKDFKEEDDDDEKNVAFSEFIEKISAASERLTGKTVSRRERRQWGTLADLLVLELESAARRTGQISSTPAFLTEVLRRKLLSGGAAKTSKNKKTKPDTVGKPNESGEYEIKSLGDESKEAAVYFLQEFKDDAEFLDGYKKWYAEEDWTWITERLKSNSAV